MMEWNVVRDDMNTRQFKPFNIFNHYYFFEDCKKEYKKHKNNKEEFLSRVKRCLQYYFWSKCEWELILSPWPPRDEPQKKVDAFGQVMLNWDRFSEYIWDHRKELH